jgi:5'-3' exoribonuclease 1
MGVKHFYLYTKQHFKECLLPKPDRVIDNLAIDLNGLFHLCAQKVYRYGNVTTGPRLLSKPTLTQLCREVCQKIDHQRDFVKPQKRLILCVDGIAGLGKMNQQRQRRFRAGKESPNRDFDSNAFTPGTELMDYLTKYIDGYIKMMISTSPDWKDLEVVYSNEKVPGEGEHKIMQYIKHLNKPHETLLIYGLDADLIMLGMLLPIEHVYIFREMEYDVHHTVDINMFRTRLLKLMKWDHTDNEDYNPEQAPHERVIPGRFSSKIAIYDFVLLCFIVGNDFLPTIPSMAILDGTIDLILRLYKRIGFKHGHIVKQHPQTKKLTFRLNALKEFFKQFAAMEHSMLENKYNEGQSFFPDSLVMQNLTPDSNTGRMVLNFRQYKIDYYRKKFGLEMNQLKALCHKYIDGMDWVLNYYVNAIPDWMWFFPHLYAPFLSDLMDHVDDYTPCVFPITQPVDPFLQLLVVMPPTSKNLLPLAFHQLYDNHSSLDKYFPATFEINVEGKRKEWEGIVELPLIHIPDFEDVYKTLKSKFNEKEQKRNIRGKSFVYRFQQSQNPVSIRTLYGVIPQYNVNTTIIKI